MEIYALVGKSGTGKSYKAQTVAGMFNIEYMLDDGLFIRGTKVIAGISAKGEDTKIAAVRRAVYSDKEHRRLVTDAIIAYSPEKILVLGTSEHMINSIISALNLDEDYKLIRIEDISTNEELEIAGRARRIKGKHVIPVPTFEIKKAFSGYFIDSIKHLAKRNEKAVEQYEKTVVRPTFSYLGSYEIKDGVIKSIAEESAISLENIHKVVSVDIENKKEGIIIVVTVIPYFRVAIPQVIDEMAEQIKNNVEYMTGINVIELNTIIKSLII